MLINRETVRMKKGLEADNNITFSEACTILKKSKRTVSRYIKAGKLNPKKIKSRKGIEYRFDLTELESLRKPDTTGQMTRQINFDDKNNDTLSVLKIIKILEKQLKAKEREIHELHILLGKSQETIYMLEDKSKGKRPDKNDRTDDTISQVKWQWLNGWVKRLFNKAN